MEFGEELCQFMQNCPTPFQFAQVASIMFLKAGYENLIEDYGWGENPPKKGFVIRDDRALIAFNIGGYESGIIVGAHCDSPVLRLNVKRNKNTNEEVVTCDGYGGGNWVRWFDRPLKICGSVKLFNNQIIPYESGPIATIPTIESINNLRPRDPNRNFNNLSYPVFAIPKSKTLLQYVSENIGIPLSEMKSYELSLVDAYPPKIIGPNKDILSSQRIDNLTSSFAAIKAFLSSEPKNTVNILAIFDFEEVGSSQYAGAGQDFLETVIRKILPNFNQKEINAFISRSLFVSSDNAHAVHPNYSRIHDEMHAPAMGSGVCLKKSPAASYATDLTSAFPLKRAAEKIGVNLPPIINRNDIRAGSTIGPIVSTRIGIPTVDIGSPQLAMHSVRETVAVKDIEDNMKLLIEIYNNYEEYRLK